MVGKHIIVTSNKQEKSLSQKSLEGTALLIVTRFIVRMIGFISVSVTARLLTPEDFGIVGAASLVIALFAVLNQVGIGEYVVRTKEIDEEELHTIWTFRVILSGGIAGLIFLLAPWAAQFLQEPRLTEILRILCITSLLGSLRAPAAEFFNRNMQYNRILFLAAADKIVAVSATIIAALILQSYWALVWGQVIGMSFAILSSQIARPFKPRLTLSRFSKLKNLALWTFLVGLNTYGVKQVDEWIAKRASDSAAFGAYHVARDLCRLFVAELLAPAGQVFLPAIAKVQDDKEKMSDAVGRLAGAAFIAGFAVSVGIASISNELVYLLLGYQWGQAIPYVPYVAIGTAAMIVCDLFQGLYVVDDKQNISTRFRFGRLLSLLVGCITAAQTTGDLLHIAMTFAGVSIITVALELSWLFARTRYNVALLPRVWRPLTGAIAMFYAVSAVALPQTWLLPVVTGLKVLVGAMTYLAVIGLLWLIAGKPKGGETEFMDRIAEYLKR